MSGAGCLPLTTAPALFGEKAMGLSPNVIMEHVKTRGSVTGHGCMPGCVLRCSTILNDEKGGYLTSGYEFETAAACGSNLGIGDLDMLLRIDRACDELGIDTMEFGATVGILNDVGLFEFGDADKVMSYLEEVRQNTPMGRIIGSGCANAAKVLGISRVPAVKRAGAALSCGTASQRLRDNLCHVDTGRRSYGRLGGDGYGFQSRPERES